MKRTFAVLAVVFLWLGGITPAHAKPRNSAEETTTTQDSAAHLLWYRVRRGDTLDAIASRYKVSVPEIRRWNHLRSSRIDAGKRLRLYVGSHVRTARVRRRVVHVRRHFWSPWDVPSHGDPTAYDDPAGEDLPVRQAAITALGKWNGSIVVVNPNNGRILSIVNQKLALDSGYEPCSSMKPVWALAALKEGVITPKTRLWVGFRHPIPLTYALAHSNNRFFYELGEKLGFQKLEEYAREFGLGERAGLDIPGESPGYFPSAPPTGATVGDVAYTGDGVQVTALQMAAIVSAIANGGTLYYLQYPRTPEEVQDFVPRVRRHLTNIAPYIPEVRAGMAAVVTQGTGRMAYEPGDQIYGKTGTCTEDRAHLGWFVSYSADTPQRVVIVLLRGGRPMFGPHAAKVAGRVYHDLRQINQSTAANETSENYSTTGRAGTER